jgi:hypothetical protein
MRTRTLRWAGVVLALPFACQPADSSAEEVRLAGRLWAPNCTTNGPAPVCPPAYCPPVVPPYDVLPGDVPPVDAPPDAMPPEGTSPDQTPPDVPQLPDAPPQFDTSANLDSVTNNLPQVASTTGSVAPGMIGDEFGGMGSMMSGGNVVGAAVHHTTSVNDFHFIIGDDLLRQPTGGGGGPIRATFIGGPGLGGPFLSLPGQGFSGPAPPVGDVVTGLVVGGPITVGPNIGNPGDGPFTATRSNTFVTILPADDNGRGLSNVPVFLISDARQAFVMSIPSPGSGGGASVGRQKIGENTSPLPRDRVFVNYSYFDNTSIFNGVNVSRVTPGFEKTFIDDMMSFEARFPFASTLDSDILQAGGTNTDEIEFGNVTMYLKALLWQGGRRGRNDLSISSGIGMTLPTADDVRVLNAAGNPLVVVENESIHVLPFVGALYTPNSRLFTQAFVQLDLDTNGNTVEAINFANGNLGRAGIANDTTFLFADVGVGYWVHQSNDPNALVRGVAPTLEMHYNRSLNDADVIVSGPFRVGDFAENIEVFNAVAGVNLNCRHDVIVTAGYTVPIGGGADQQFDGEFRLILNWFFGATNRQTRAQF